MLQPVQPVAQPFNPRLGLGLTPARPATPLYPNYQSATARRRRYAALMAMAQFRNPNAL